MSDCGDGGAKPTRCDGDRRNNCWIEGGNPETGEGGVCLLDTLSDEQVIYAVERNEKAREDLKKVTTDPTLLAIAENVASLPKTEYADDLQSQVNRNAETIPFYTHFRGQPPWNG